MTTIIYYCNQCGLRLTAIETQSALERGEDVHSGCCNKCRNASASSVPDLESAAPLPARSAARSTSAQVAPRRADRDLKIKTSFPIVPFVAGMGAVAVVLMGLVAVFKRNPAPADQPPATVEPRISEGPSPVAATPVANLPQRVSMPVGIGATINSVSASVTSSQSQPSGEVEAQAALIESLLRQRSFGRALERMEQFERQPNAKEKQLIEKVAAWRIQAETGSKALLEELLNTARLSAEKGDARGVQAALGPRPLMDLLPQHAQSALEKANEFSARASELAKVEQARRDEESAHLRANFETSLPSEPELGAPLGGKVLFGPGASGANVESGRESVRSAEGKAAYIDGSRSVAFSHASNLGMIQAGNDVCIEYTATQDVQVYVKVSGEKDVGGTITLPAGKLQRKAIAIDNKRSSSDGLMLNFKGHWAGRSFKRVSLEFKNIAPGSLAVFRVSVK